MDTDFQEWHQFKVKADKKKTTSVFGFWLTAVENIDFVTQNLANDSIFGDDLVDFFWQSTPFYKYTSEENRHLTYVLIMSVDL